MSMRGLGAVLVLALIGLVGGYAVGQHTREQPTTVAVASPVPARNPSFPVNLEKPYAADIPFPALQAGLTYRRASLGDAPYEWDYQVPKGWKPTQENLDEVRWRPPGEPIIGGYSLRVKLSTEHKTKDAMVSQKLAAMNASYSDVQVLGQTGDLLSFSYRDPTRNTQRFNTFRWFSVPGETEARFEMSVVGRGVDQDGLEDLLEKVGASITKVQ